MFLIHATVPAPTGVFSCLVSWQKINNPKTASQSSAVDDNSKSLSHNLMLGGEEPMASHWFSATMNVRNISKTLTQRKKTFWEEISKELKLKGAMKCVKMCEMKLKNLKRSYVNCVDHNNTSGNDPKNRNFFAELHESFSCDDAIQPQAIWMALNVSKGQPAMKGEAVHSHHQQAMGRMHLFW